MHFLHSFLTWLFPAPPADWPNDQRFGEQWAWRQIGWLTAFKRGMPSKTDKPVIVAVLDSGVDPGHPDLAGLLLPGVSLVLGGNWYEDPNGHGTAMASIIAARTNNQTGMAGIAFANVQILPVKVIGEHKWGGDVARAIYWAADHGARVISMSFSSEPRPGEQEAIHYAWRKGCVLVAAAGNDGKEVDYPAAYEEVLGVAGTDKGDHRWLWSSHGSHAQISAPAVDVLAARPARGYTHLDGTSAATAIVAGAAALLLVYHPQMTNKEVVGRLIGSATPLENAPGRINLAAALGDAPYQPVIPNQGPETRSFWTRFLDRWF
jgi:subtilisin family serine protease